VRILLAANASYVPPRGGATRSNLAWLERLAVRGHECRVVAAALAHDVADAAAQLRDEQIEVRPLGAESTRDAFGHEAVRSGALVVYSAAAATRRSELLHEQLRGFRPDAVLVSSEDVGQPLLAEALREAPGRVVCLAHTPQFFPFGPESWYPNAQGSELVRSAASVVVIGRTMAGYVEQHLGRRPHVAHPPIYGDGPWPELARFDEGLVTIVNPCAIKGLSIVLELARALPGCHFGALPGWGTTAADRRALEALPNVTLLPNRRQIDDVLRPTRVLLVPSLWYEGFGLVVVEAMLRGIPVVASDSGGLVEAKRGTRFVLPVQRIVRYEPEYDERGLPRAIVPPQDVASWIEAVRALTTDRALYEDESRRSRDAATRFVAALDPDALERCLRELPLAPLPATSRTPRTACEAATTRPPASGPALRILLAHNASYFPAHGGGDHSNRLLVEALAARGHTCRVMARLPRFGPLEQAEYRRQLEARGVPVSSTEHGIVGFHLNGVEARVLASHTKPRAAFARELASFAPDVILGSTDDPAQLLLEGALQHPEARVVYLARAPVALPFGPESAFPSATKTELLRRVDRVVAVSEYVARYVREWSGIEAVHVPISLMEPGPYPELGRFDNELVTLVNPCAVKGISILLALADRMPDVAFAAVPTWGTNEQDRRALAARRNVRVLPPVDRIDELLARTRVLLVPSLWAEARSRIIVEAMLRGVPVLASDVGGIPEAMMGVPYLLPVRKIARFRPELDEQMVPRAEVPPQDVAPWQAALRRVIGDRAHYQELSRASRAAALDHVSRLGVGPFEALLHETLERPLRRGQRVPAPEPPPNRRPTSGGEPPPSRSPTSGGRPADLRGALAGLSPEKRELLALRLEKRVRVSGQDSVANPWLPGLTTADAAVARLFCLPHAGAGASVFRGWSEGLPGSIHVCPVQLPGREGRADEPAFRDMPNLVAALGAAISPHTDTAYALFGHSVGAGIAFELARWLRGGGRPLPFALVVSGARAPQSRVGRAPQAEPTREELIAELRARDGTPTGLLDDPEFVRALLPLLGADTALYRSYVYVPEEPLAVPLRAYGGADDPHVSRDDLDAWRAQTTASFERREFPGGHFYLRSARSELLQALGRDLAETLASR
jgi:surfactin synthase thioesterase subunit/glycosyltransferase involved in cell wall biosynthesis